MTGSRKYSPEAKDIIKMSETLSKNIAKSVLKEEAELTRIIKNMESLSSWKLALRESRLSRLMDEIFLDIRVSLEFACFALYKYAEMGLRSSLENSLNLVYFSSHPTEFGWWEKGSEWYLEGGEKRSRPWGNGYGYFKLLIGNAGADPIFDQKADSSIPRTYKELSKSIHSSSYKLQSRKAQLTPTFELPKFAAFNIKVQEILSQINALFALVFQSEFAKIRTSEKAVIVALLLPAHRQILTTFGLIS